MENLGIITENEFESLCEYFLHEMNAPLLSMYIQATNKSEIINHFKELFKNDKELHAQSLDQKIMMKWLLHSVLGRYDKTNDIFIKTFPLYILQKLNPRVYSLLYQYNISKNHGKMSSSEILDIIEILEFLKEYPQLLAAMQQFVSPLIERVPEERIFKVFGIDSLQLYINPPIEYISKAQLKIKSFGSCFSYPINYSSPALSQILQIRFSSNFVFPLKFPEAKDGLDFSLANTSIIRKKHYIDILSEAVKNEILQNRNPNKAFEMCASHSDLFPWLICATIKFYLKDLKLMNSIAKTMKTNFSDGFVLSIIKRLLNDIKLLVTISEIHRKTYKTLDLQSQSIPLLFSRHLQSQEVEKLLGKSFFIVSDAHRDIDFDFIHSYHILSTILEYIGARPKDSKSNQDALEIIKKEIMTIQNPESQKRIAEEVFSLLFLQVKGNYVCTLSFAQKILNLLRDYFPSQEVEEMRIAAKAAMVRNGVDNLGRAMIDRRTLFIRELGSKNLEGAEILSRKNPNLRSLYDASQSVSLICTDSSFSTEDDLINTEAALSAPGKISLINKVQKPYEEAAYVAARRKEGNEDPLVLFDTGKEIENVRKIDEGESVSINPRFKNTNAFVQFDSLLRSEKGGGDLTELLLGIASRDDAMKVANDLKRGGFDIFGFWLQHSSDSPFKNGVGQFVESYPLESLSLVACGAADEPTDFDYEKYGPVIKKWMTKKFNGSYIDLIKKEQYDEALAAIYSEYGPEPPHDILVSLFDSSMRNLKTSLSLFDDFVFKIDLETVDAMIEANYMKYRLRSLISLQGTFIFPPDAKFYILAFQTMTVGEFENPTTEDFAKGHPYDECLSILMEKFDLQTLLDVFDRDRMSSLLPVLCEKLIKSESDVDELLKRFPELIGEMFTFYYSDHCFLPVFIRHCDPSNRQAFRALLSVPGIVKLDKDFDFSSEKISEIVSQDLMGYTGVDQLKPLLRRYNYLCDRFPESKRLFTENMRQIMLREIKLLKVTSITKEMRVRRAISIFRKFPLVAEEAERIDVIMEFMDIGVFQFLSIPYSFEKYPTIEFAQTATDILFNNGFDNTAMQFSSVFGVKISEHAERRLKVCLSIGLVEEARFWAQFATVTDEIIESTLAYGLISTDAFINELVICDVEKIPSAVASFSFLNATRVLCRTKPPKSMKRTSDLQSFISYYVQPSYNTIKVLCKYGFLDTAFAILCSLHQTEYFTSSFIHGFIFESISRGRIKTIIDFLYSRDPGLSFILPLLIALIDYFKENHMYVSLYSFFSSMNWLEDAAIAAVNCFNNTEGYVQKLKMLYHAEELLNQASSIRQGVLESSPDTFPFRPSDLSDKQLDMMLKIISVQNRLLETAHKLRNDNLYEMLSTLITSERGVNVAAAFAVIGHFEHVDSIVELFNVKQHILVNQIVQDLSETTFDEIKRFLGMAKRQRPKFFEVVFPRLLQVLMMKTKMWYFLPALVGMFVDKLEEQCMIFIEFGFLSEAIEITTRKELKHLLPQIGHKASLMGNDGIVNFVTERLTQ